MTPLSNQTERRKSARGNLTNNHAHLPCAHLFALAVHCFAHHALDGSWATPFVRNVCDANSLCPFTKQLFKLRTTKSTGMGQGGLNKNPSDSMADRNPLD